ncbi:hypothetical protein [Acidocella sp.]|jgi:hypothetical protein|uniref:hypothetical protein n=1 Tax=Acidocella sp. TaxID=50710 RepID=UPI002F42B458
MYAQTLSRHRTPGLVASVWLLTVAAWPGGAWGQSVAADPVGLLASAGFAQYSLTDAQLGKIRGGFSLPNGISFSFGFQQETSVNGAVIQSVIVPDTALTANLTQIPVYVDQTKALSLPVGGTAANIPITVTTMTNAGATAIQTTLSSGGIVNSISNSVNNQDIEQVSQMSISVSGLAAAAAAAEVANRVLSAGTLGVRLP